MKKLYLVTGFLGAGKTTFVNEIFDVFGDVKTSVIVNEFGKVGIDGGKISEKGYEVTEINEGSIFCVCRIDMFMEALKEAYKSDCEVLIVETSGLSDPTGTDEILSDIDKISGCRYDYKGCICIADALNFKKVLNTASAVASQVRNCSLALINKTDIAGETQIFETEELIKSLNPYCKIVKTSFCKIPEEEIKGLKLTKINTLGNQVDIVSSSLTVKFPENADYKLVLQFLNEVKNIIYRCKGYVKTEKGNFFIDGVMDDIKIQETVNIPEKDENYLVLLYNSKNNVKKTVKNFCKTCEIKII